MAPRRDFGGKLLVYIDVDAYMTGTLRVTQNSHLSALHTG